MNDFADDIRRWLEERGWQQKDLAAAWHTAVGTGAFATYEPKLTKLLKGDDEGFKFVLDGDEARVRREALAAVLGREPEGLRAALESARQRRTLILDPRLPPNQRQFFLDQQRLGGYLCVEPNGGSGGSREALRDLARESRNPCVVVADGRDAEFLRGAGLPWSTVSPASPGFRLPDLPEVVVPPRAARELDDDGTPMLLAPTVEQDVRKHLGDAARGLYAQHYPAHERSPLVSYVERADQDGSPVTFPLPKLIAHWGGRKPAATELVPWALDRATGKRPDPAPHWVYPRASPPAYIWEHGGAVCALGAEGSKALETIAAHLPDRIRDVTADFDVLVEAVRRVAAGLNPWGRSAGPDTDLSTELHTFEAVTGIALAIGPDQVRAAMAAGFPRNERPHSGPLLSMHRSAEDDARLLAVIAELLARKFELLEQQAFWVFRLQALLAADLVHIDSTPSAFAAVAHLGAGHLLRVDLWQYEHEEPHSVRLIAEALDGGNVRLVLTSLSFDSLLEGTFLRAAARRREREAKAARDAYDDE
ncbi:MAG: hypothetical protein HY825_14585 [Acidobacteria bacterium]|nr:hypothetical protein [Acidobacteriota bacterium]